MKLEYNVSGTIGTNVYLIAARDADGTDRYLLVDPADDLEATRRFLAGRVPALIVCTHRHLDHVTSVGALVEEFGCPVAAHVADAAVICARQDDNMLGIRGYVVPKTVDRLLVDGDAIEVGDCRLEVIHTPGHTPGGICLYDEVDGILISGDTLFAQSTGRTDFEEGSDADMHASIRRLAQLPDATKVYPGHGPSTTIGDERWWMERY